MSARFPNEILAERQCLNKARPRASRVVAQQSTRIDARHPHMRRQGAGPLGLKLYIEQ